MTFFEEFYQKKTTSSSSLNSQPCPSPQWMLWNNSSCYSFFFMIFLIARVGGNITGSVALKITSLITSFLLWAYVHYWWVILAFITLFSWSIDCYIAHYQMQIASHYFFPWHHFNLNFLSLFLCADLNSNQLNL